MKKVWIALTVVLVLCGVLSFFFVHPVTLYNNDETRVRLYVGRAIHLDGVSPRTGGYRCYPENDTESYFWVSEGAVNVAHGKECQYIYKLRGKDVLQLP